MRVTFLAHFPGRGGSSAGLMHLRRAFQAAGHDVSVVVGADSPDAVIPEYQVVPDSPDRGWRARMWDYREAVQLTRPDLVYSLSGKEELDVLRFLDCPRARHVFSLERHDFLDMPRLIGRVAPYLEAVSANTPDVLEELPVGPAERWLALYQMAPEFFRAPEVTAGRTGAEPLQACFVGRFEDFQKRADWLPVIADRCAAAGANLEWHLYGDGPLAESMKAAARASRATMHFHGWVGAGELAGALGRHDLFFLCSRWEGLPVAMCEAMLSGLACVVPDNAGGMGYVVRQGGGWGYLAESPTRAAEQLLKVVGDRDEVLRRRRQAQAWARDFLAPERVSEALTRLVQRAEQLTFNGRVEQIERAPRLRALPVGAVLQRRARELASRLMGRNFA